MQVLTVSYYDNVDIVEIGIGINPFRTYTFSKTYTGSQVIIKLSGRTRILMTDPFS